MDVLMAALPILLTLGLLAAPLPSWVPPTAGLATAVGIGLGMIGTGWGELAGSVGESFWTLVEVVCIIAGGILLSRVMDRTGAQHRLALWLSAGGGPTVASALLMVHGVVPFLESVTGFGVSVIIGLPLLLSFGFTPLRAAVLTLLALTVGPWGSMGPGTLVAAEIAGVGLRELGLASGVLNIVAFVGSGIVAGLLAGRGTPFARAQTGRIPWAALAAWSGAGIVSGLVLSALVLAANWLLGTAVAGAVGTLVLSALWVTVIRRGRLRPGPGLPLVPYLILMLGTTLGQALAATLPLGAVGEVLGSPALWSTTSAVIALFMLHLPAAYRRLLPRETGRMWLQIAVPTGLYLLLGTVVAGTGLAEILAGALTQLGPAYMFLVPFVGALGGFITASGTGANAMFGATQAAAAQALGVSPLWMMALQNAAAGLACLASPARVELAYRIAYQHQWSDTPGRLVTRGRLFRAVLPFVLVTTAIWGLIALLFVPRG